MQRSAILAYLLFTTSSSPAFIAVPRTQHSPSVKVLPNFFVSESLAIVGHLVQVTVVVETITQVQVPNVERCCRGKTCGIGFRNRTFIPST